MDDYKELLRAYQGLPKLKLTKENEIKLSKFFYLYREKIEGFLESIPESFKKDLYHEGEEPNLPILFDPRIKQWVWLPDLTKEKRLELMHIVGKELQWDEERKLKKEFDRKQIN